ncbi:hypothetical protein B9479_004294 [Cryptococcus floricola]|uniref:Uncharacterized protein n=1 Tax=Cryptococcus floricola TaxID=2591691 RepID=A0A5D3AY26_9TREE|nr:hypothetical protein B9479_004294 [Cryptococcus floricola]
MSAGDNALIEKMDRLDVEEGSRTTSSGDVGGIAASSLSSTETTSVKPEETNHSADAISSSPILEQPPCTDDELPSSIHPDFAVRTGNVLLVTDDDVGFYVDQSFLSSQSEFFRDFEEMASDVGQGNVSNIGTRVVRRDLPGALSNGLRVVLFMARENTWRHCGYNNQRKVFHPWPTDGWQCDLEDLALAFQIGNRYGFTIFCLQPTDHHAPFWAKYLSAVFEDDEKAAKAMLKSICGVRVQYLGHDIVFIILDKERPRYSALFKNVRTLNPFWSHPFAFPAEHYRAAESHAFIKKEKTAFKRKRKAELGGRQCVCLQTGAWWMAASRAGHDALRENLMRYDTCAYGALDMSISLFLNFATEDDGVFQMTWWYDDEDSSEETTTSSKTTSTYVAPTTTYTPPTSTYTPPTSTYTPPTSTYTPPPSTSTYTPPTSTYVAPSSSSSQSPSSSIEPSTFSSAVPSTISSSAAASSSAALSAASSIISTSSFPDVVVVQTNATVASSTGVSSTRSGSASASATASAAPLESSVSELAAFGNLVNLGRILVVGAQE